MHRRSTVRSWGARAASALLAGALVVPLGMSGATAHDGTDHDETEPFSALVFSKTAAFRHSSIPAGIAAIEELGEEHGFEVTATEDAAAFTSENLAQYDVVVWLSTTGDVLNNQQQAAFEEYIQNGGGYAGIHAASDTEYDWPWYGELVGAYFASHPPGTPTATVVVEDPAHPSTEHLPARWERTDEWYSFRSNPRGDVHVLASLDESTYDAGNGAMAPDHPIAWCHDYDGGRAWYTGGGHTDASFSEPEFRDHMLEGIRTAAGVLDADCSATLDESFDKVELDLNTQNPMDLAPAPDGRTIYIERDGRVQIVQPNGGTVTAATLPVTQVQEFGLLGIELDPGFEENGWVYLYYSPQGSSSDRVSRFTLGENTLDVASEQVLLEVPVQRSECCHAGGALEFDGEGNLYVATGDNTNPFASDGFSPIDERPGRAAWDAQGTSGNTNDLRGKILRITPQDDGSVTIPEGNLFAPGTDKTRPEIFAMGFRNPFKIGMDPRTDTLLVADYGPDAGAANPDRGPAGMVEWNIVQEPGNYGWPHCVGANDAYRSYDFATQQPGAAFDCANGPTNDSPNNTGLTQLPPVVPATIWYQNNNQRNNAPEIGSGGGAPMAGSVYVYDEELASARKWPAYFDGKAAFAEWNTGKLFTFQMNDDTTEVVDINRILESMSFRRPHALEWGADGALYIIEWGSGFGGNNADSGVYRLDYLSGQRAPIARAEADVTNGPLPLEVTFSSEGSRDPEGGPVTLAWDFGDGETSTEANPTHTYTEAGNYTATLTVTNADGVSTSTTVLISAGNTAPTVTVEMPPNGGFFNFGDVVQYKVTVTDPEDGEEIDCNDVIVQPALGHDEHAHPYDQYRGCEGAIPVNGDTGHIGANIFGVITVTYTDQGAEGVDPLTTQEVIILQPKRKEAEYFAETGRLPGSTSTGDPGVQVEATEDVGGGQNVGFAEVDDWFSFDPTNLTGIDSIRLRAASQPGGTVDIRTGAPDGESIGTITVPANTWQSWANHDVALPEDVTTESGPLYFVITSGQANVNWVQFIGRGVTDNESPAVEITTTATSGPAPLAVAFTATATDPDGDTPLTYAWSFGDGATADTAEASHTYTTPGRYTASVTVTDARGASTIETVQVNVTAPGLQCLDGRSDGFDGDALDTERWDESLRVNQDLRVEDGNLVIPTSSTDIYGTDNGDVPNVVLQDLPEGPFTATTRLTLNGSQAYQQGGLIIYGDADNYAKMVFSGRSTSGSDPASRVFQFIREEAGQPNEVNASLSPAVGADHPSTVWVRFVSDGQNLVASYSANGTDFTEMSETKLLAGMTDPKIGLFALQGAGQAQAPVDVEFDYFHIVPDDSVAPVDPSDEFDGSTLDGCRWEIVRPDPQHMRVVDGHLELDATAGDIYGTDNGTPNNFVVQDLGDGDWTVETLVDASTLTRQYEQGGLIAYVDDDNYVKLDISARNSPGSALTLGLEALSEVDGAIQNPQPAATVQQAVWHLRLAKVGTDFTGSYSADGEEWTTFASIPNAPVAASGKVGLFALGTSSTDNQPVTFDYFRVDGDEEPEPVTVTPQAVVFTDAAGTAGDTYTIPAVEGVEYLVDGDVVEAGTYPGSGTVTVTARALDGFVIADGATTEWSFTFATTGGEPEPVEVRPAAVTFTELPGTANDTFTVPATQGVEYLVDGEVVTAGTYPGSGTVTVTARATDGYVLADDATAQWSYTFATTGGEQPEPEPEPQPQPPVSQEHGFFLSNDWKGGTAHAFHYGRFTDEVFIGDWDGDGEDSIAVRRGNVFHVANSLRAGTADSVFVYGRPGDTVLVGDWNGDGKDTFAVRRGNVYHVKNSLSGGVADTVVAYGRTGDVVLVGDWDGDGRDTLAVRRGAEYFVKNSLTGGVADKTFAYGRAGDITLAGDWDGDGTDTLAVRRGGTYLAKNSLSGGNADLTVTYGGVTDQAFVGDWDGNGTDTLGLRRLPPAVIATALAALGQVIAV